MNNYQIAAEFLWDRITWRPRIGDPGVFGWLTVALYITAAILCYRAWRTERRLPGARPRFWLFLTCALALLGVNKQLDIQSLFTQVARETLRHFGWLSQRRELQFAFILAVVLAAVLTVGAIVWRLRTRWRRYVLAVMGFALLAAFVVIRAASFHHVDQLLRDRIWVFRMNHVMEMGSLAILCAGAIVGMRGSSAGMDRPPMGTHKHPS